MIFPDMKDKRLPASDAAKLFSALSSPSLSGPGVEAFRYWVNAKVLPAIFATGGYILNPDCISSSMVSDMDRMPLPCEAGSMLSAIALDDAPLRSDTRTLGEASDTRTDHAELQPCPADYFRRVRALGDHPAVRDLNELVDAIVMPALFADVEAFERLTAVVSAAEAEAPHLDI